MKVYRGYKYEILRDEVEPGCMIDVKHEYFQIFNDKDFYNGVENEYNTGDLLYDFSLYLKDNGMTLKDIIVTSTKYSNKIVFITKDNVRDMYHFNRITDRRERQIVNDLTSWMKDREDVFNGNVYYYNIYEDNEVIESCGSFVGAKGLDTADKMIKQYIDIKIKGGE